MTARAELLHRTMETGRERRSPLSEEDPAALTRLRPLLAAAVTFHQPVHVGESYWITAHLTDARLRASIWHGSASGPALVTLQVTRGAGEAPPVLVVSIRRLMELAAGIDPKVVAALGDLERRLAWAWLTTNDT